MDGIRFDFRQLDDLADGLDRAVDLIPAGTRAAVQKGSLNIKTDWRRRWSGHPHIKQIVPTITYDTTETSTRVVGEIGPDRSRGRAAALANIPEYGTVNNPPIPGGIPAVAAEEPRFEKAMQDLAVKALGL
jgi:hypothetical protein